MTKQLLLIDGNSIVFRAFFAMHSQIDKFTNKDGLHTAAIYGFKLMLDHVLDSFHPDAALVAFDAGKVTFRTKMYSDYKGGRNKTPEELTEQLPYVRQLVKASGLHSYELSDYEADDIIGTLAKEADDAGYTTLIVTGDRDLTQLASDHTTVAVTHKGVTETEHYTPAHVEEKLETLHNLRNDVAKRIELMVPLASRVPLVKKPPKERKRLRNRQRHHLADRLPGDGGDARELIEPRPVAVGTRPVALVGGPLRPRLIVLRLVDIALKHRKDALERTVHAPPREDEVLLEPVHEFLAERWGKFLVGS